MAMLLDDYTLLEKFLVGLPLWMALKMIEDFGLSPESNSPDNFKAMAKAMEQHRKMKTYYKAMKWNVRGNTLMPNNRALPKTSPAPCQANMNYNAQCTSLPRRSLLSPTRSDQIWSELVRIFRLSLPAKVLRNFLIRSAQNCQNWLVLSDPSPTKFWSDSEQM